MGVHWSQHDLVVPARPRGVHLITPLIRQAIGEVSTIDVGLLHVFLAHTSAALTLNENADPDVRTDLNAALDRLAPDNGPYLHTCEGPDDMPAHIKTVLLGNSVTVPVRNGQLALGTWQGIYLCEFRDRATPRKLLLTLQGRS